MEFKFDWLPAGKKLTRLYDEMGKRNIKVGFEDTGYEDGTTVAQVAVWNEYGTSNSPARPFMRGTIENQTSKIERSCESHLRDAIESGSDAKQCCNAIGSDVKGFMQMEIRNGEYAENAPSTIAKKGSSNPLIDTGRMRQSVVYKVE